MFALGEPMDAAGALASGLANAVVPQADLRKKAHDSNRADQAARGFARHDQAADARAPAIAAQIAEEGVLSG